MIQQLRIAVFAVFHPCRTAGGEHGELASVFEAVQELMSFLHDRKVSRQRGVRHMVKAETLQRSDNLADGIFTVCQTEFLTEGNTDCRRNLGNHALGRIEKNSPDIGNVSADPDRVGRTDSGALTAADALRVGQRLIKCRLHTHVGATVYKFQNSHSLKLVAGADTVTAEDALVGVADDGRGRIVDWHLLTGILKADVADAVAVSQLLQLTGTALSAERTVAVVGRQKQLNDHLAVL